MTERIRFLDDARPALAGGDYVLRAEQTVELPAPYAPETPPAYATTQRLRVAGPRFGLAPGDVVATYPPQGSTGAVDEVLAHVVLDRRTLPWEIAMPGAPEGTPWLALLLLAPDELIAPPGAGPTGAHAVDLAREFLALPADGPVAGPEHDRERALDLPATDPGTPPRGLVVDVRADAFAAVAPRLDELRWLAHVRETDQRDQATPAAPTDRWYAVVVANRLPDAAHSATWHAHLVSLDGFAGRLPGGAPPQDGAVRLLSLASWTFGTAADGPSFAALMRTVAGRAAPLALPEPAAATDVVATACAGGWSPLEHRTRTGVRTVSWYRGPAAPVRVASNPQPAFPSSDAALLLDPRTGMFDVSYASAWQLGRLLALRNRAFTAAWSGWIRDLCAGAHAAAEQAAQGEAEATARVAEQLTGAAPLGPDADPSGVRDEAHRLPALAAVDATPTAGEDPALAVARAALGGAS